MGWESERLQFLKWGGGLNDYANFTRMFLQEVIIIDIQLCSYTLGLIFFGENP